MALSEVGLVVFDLNARRVYVDDIAARIMGGSKEELLGGEIGGGGLVPEAREEMKRLFQRCIETGEATARNVLERLVHGKTVHTMGHLAPLRDSDGSVTGVLATISDVTEAVTASQEAKRSRELYRSLAEAVGGAVIRHDRTGKRTFVNRGAEQVKGRSRDELLKSSLGDDMLPEDRATVYELLEKVFQTGEPIYGITTRQMVGGEIRHVLANWVPVFDQDGSVREVQTTSIDVTEQVTMREQLRSYGARIRKVQEEEREAISRVLHDDTIQALTAIGHRIDGFIARNSQLPEDEISELELLAETALNQTDALRRLCMGLRPAMLDSMGLGSALEWFVKNACAGVGVQGEVRVDAELSRLNPTVEIRLFRIAQEAVNNAVRHAQASRIDVSLVFKDGQLELDVRDDGVGFDTRTHPAEELGGGKLGLMGMQERAHILGVDLDIQSRPGEGTRVFLHGSVEQIHASA